MIGYLTANHPLIRAFQSRPTQRVRRASLADQRVFLAAPTLADYFQEHEILVVKGELDRRISGLACDSRRVVSGNVFFALTGEPSDSATAIDEEISRGAVAVVAEKIPAFVPAKVTFVRVADVGVALARVAQRYYKSPDHDLTVVGVTGARGQTAVAHLLQHVLADDGARVGLLGAIHYDLGARTVPALRTPPAALDVFGLMAQMRDAGCRHAVCEFAARDLAQQRLHGIEFGAAIFTEFASEEEFAAQARLFHGANGPVPRLAIVNVDDPRGEKFAAKLAAERPDVRVVTFGESRGAEVRVEIFALHIRGAVFRIEWPSGARLVDSPLIGRANVSHALAVFATAWALGREPADVLARLNIFDGVPGHLERVDDGQLFNVFVDVARTPEALRRTLETLRPLTPGKLRVVFGCDSEQAGATRAAMVGVAQEFADFVCATADNPRTERIADIFDDMRAGVSEPERIAWVGDRRAAIAAALAASAPGDCVLIAGKGHEATQEMADTVFPFDDRQVVRELLAPAASNAA